MADKKTASPPAPGEQAETIINETITLPTNAAEYREARYGKKSESRSEKGENSTTLFPPKTDPGARQERTEQTTAPDSESGKKETQDKKGKAESRTSELRSVLDEFKELGIKPSEAKAYLNAAKGEKPPEKTENPPKPAEKKEVKPPPPPEKPKRPRYGDYDTDEDYETAMDEYEEKKEKWDVYQEQQRELARERARAERELGETLHKSVKEAAKHYGDDGYETIKESLNAILTTEGIANDVKAAINESVVMPHLLYTIKHDDEVFQEFLDAAKTHPTKAFRMLRDFEVEIMKELGVEDGSEKTGQEEEEAEIEEEEKEPENPEKPATGMPSPTRPIEGKKGTPADAQDKAFKSNDVEGFRAEETRKRLARTKGL